MDNSIKMIPYTACYANKRIYFLDGKSRFIYGFDYVENRVRLIKKIYDIEQGYGYFNIRVSEDALYMMPDTSDQFVAYDFINENCVDIEYDAKGNEGEKTHRKIGLLQSFLHNKQLIGIPVDFDRIFTINVIEKSLCCTPLSAKQQNMDSIIAYGSGSIVDEKIYLPAYGQKLICEIDIPDMEVLYRHVSIKGGLSSLCINNKEIFAVDVCGEKLYGISRDDWSVEEYPLELPCDFKQSSHNSNTPQVFIGCVEYKKHMWLIPYYSANGVLCYELSSKKLERHITFSMCDIYTYVVENEKLLLCTSNGLVEISMENGEVKEYLLTLDKIDNKEYLNEYFDSKDLVQEDKVNLCHMIEYLSNQ